MAKKKFDLQKSEKEKGLNVEFTNEAETEPEKKEQVPSTSFLQLFRFATNTDKVILIIGIIGALIAGALQPLNTVLFGDLTQDIVNYVIAISNTTDPESVKEEFLDNVRHFCILNTALGIGIFISTYIATQTFNYCALKQTFKIRSLYLQRLLNQDISWYDMHETGDLSSRMSEDLAKFEDGIGEKVPTFINFQGVFFASLIIALVKGWELALICLTSLPMSLICIGIIGILTSKVATKELDAYGSAGSIAEEVLSSVRTVVAFGGQSKETGRYDKNLVFAKNNNIKRSFFNALGFGLLWFIIYASYSLAFWYGIGLVLDHSNDNYDMGTMITIFFSVMTGTMNFGISSPFIEAFGTARAAGSKIFSIIDNVPIINASKGVGQKVENIKGNISFKNVKFHYPSRPTVPILQGLDLEINAGQTVALVGSSGCGKSTCVQLVQRFYDPISGDVFLDGKNLKDLELISLRKNIGVVGQEPVLFGTTIIDNIRYGYDGATDEDVKNAAKKANVHEFIKTLPNGYNTLVGERGAQLSGGQKQRIAIARALVRNPSILLLDEATSALDTNSEAKVQAALDSASKECTTIIVAHRLSTIRNANKIVVISKGKVAEQGTHDELMALKKEYFNLVTAQVQNAEILDQQVEDVDDDKKVVEFDDERKDSIVHTENVSEQLDDAKQLQEASFLKLLKFNSPEWPHLTIGIIGSIIMGFSMPVFGILFGDIIGVFEGNPSDDEIRSETNKFAIYFLIAGAVAGISTFAQILSFGIAGEKLTQRVRSKMFEAMLKQEMGYFDRKENGVGALCAQLSGDAAHIQGATGQRIGTIFQAIATFCLAVGLAIFYEWRLGLLTMAFTPIILLAVFFQGRLTHGDDDKKTKSLHSSTKMAVEAVSNVRTVVSLGCEEKFHKFYINEIELHHKRSLKTSHFRSIVIAIARSIMFIAYSACLFYGGYLIIDGLEYGKVFKVSQALIMGTASIGNALAFSPNLEKGVVAARKVMRLLNRQPKVKDEYNAIDRQWDQGTINYSKIEFSYPTRQSIQVLKGLDLDVIQGKTVALVGPSGCGKSTIIQLIERFYDPNNGTVTLNNENIKTLKLASLRSHLGIVSQEPNLFNRTIGENIAYGDNDREVTKQEIIEAAKNANIHNYIASLPMGYDTKLGEKGTQLSGGQKQRVAIARALVRKPRVLLLDEATSALDTESEKIVQEALDNAKRGRTCITIAHRLSTIQDADVICVINKGVVAEMGTHQELIRTKGLYYKLHTLQH